MNVRSRLSSSAGLLVVALVAGLVAGCTDRSPVETELTPVGLRVGEVAQAVVAATPYPAGVHALEIGPDGGTLHFGVGSLTFPPGALASATVITARVDGRSLGADFGPEGLMFPENARPTLRFLVSHPKTNPVILHVDGEDRVLETMETEFNRTSRIASTRLSHFSPYILAQN